jgi:hypothetical protein
VAAGARIVVEGAQNLRPGSVVSEAKRSTPEAGQGEGTKGTATGAPGKTS